MLDGVNREMNYTTPRYFERQPYLRNPTMIHLSDLLTVLDDDVGPQFLVEATITILDGKIKEVCKV